jgi:hypothetical protein
VFESIGCSEFKGWRREFDSLETRYLHAPRFVFRFCAVTSNRGLPYAQGYDKSAPQVGPLSSAFTRRREIWVGRIAMVGFVSNVLAEVSVVRRVPVDVHFILSFVQFLLQGQAKQCTKE